MGRAAAKRSVLTDGAKRLGSPTQPRCFSALACHEDAVGRPAHVLNGAIGTFARPAALTVAPDAEAGIPTTARRAGERLSAGAVAGTARIRHFTDGNDAYLLMADGSTREDFTLDNVPPLFHKLCHRWSAVWTRHSTAAPVMLSGSSVMSRLWDTPEFWIRSDADEVLRDCPTLTADALAERFERSSSRHYDPQFVRDLIAELRKRGYARVRFWPDQASGPVRGNDAAVEERARILPSSDPRRRGSSSWRTARIIGGNACDRAGLVRVR